MNDRKLAAPRTGHSLARVLSRLRVLELFSFAIVALCLVLMICGPSIAPYQPEKPQSRERLLPPSTAHWLGTDENGMDVFSRIVAAPRVDIFIGLVATLLSVFVGVPLGVVAGISEGSGNKMASLMSEGMLRLLDVLQAFPVFILAMVLVAVRGPSVENIIAAIAFVNSPVFLRLARAEILSLRERPYAEAAKSIGNTDSAIAFKHLLPNALPPLLSQVSVTVGFAILLTSGLSFVGAGIAPPTPELGAMIASGAKTMILGFWWASFFPGIALGLVVFTFSVTGDSLGRLFEPGATMAESRALESGDRPEAAMVTPLRKLKEAATASPAAETILAVDGLTVEFPPTGGHKSSPVLKDITFDVSSGEIVGVIGGPGAGKSLLVRSLLCLLPENAVARGEVRFQGRDILAMDPGQLRQLRGTGIAHILPGAKTQLNPVLRIEDMMIAVVRVHQQVSRMEARDRSAAALEAVGIMDPERRLAAYPFELSGGMAQRVCIALALLHDPVLIVADEPTFGLDVTVQRQVLDLMADLASRRGFSQLMVTRDLGIVAQYCKRVLVLQAGQVIESGPTTNILLEPKQHYSQELILSSRRSGITGRPRGAAIGPTQ